MYEYAVAEVELSRGLKMLEVEGVEKAIKQVMRAVAALKQVSNVRVIAHNVGLRTYLNVYVGRQL